jgi:ribose transport system permease protein
VVRSTAIYAIITGESVKKLSVSRRLNLGSASPAFGLVIIIALFWMFLASLAPGFLSSFNLFTVGRSLAVDIVIGFSQMVVLATGGMNLAVGAIGACTIMMAGYLMQTLGVPVPLAVVGALVLGTSLGWLNGFAIVKSGVNSFIITLASGNIFFGAMLVFTNGVPLNALPLEVGAFGKLRINLFSAALPVSPFLVIAAAIGVGLVVLYRYSVLGRRILATGANTRAAAMSGVPVGRVIIISHALSGFLAATAGVIVLARFGAAMPASGGDDWLLPSFLGPVLGGTLLSGGVVAVVGTVLGAFLVTTIRSGLLVLQIGNFWLEFVLGIILLFAVFMDRYRGVLTARWSLARE